MGHLFISVVYISIFAILMLVQGATTDGVLKRKMYGMVSVIYPLIDKSFVAFTFPVLSVSMELSLSISLSDPPPFSSANLLIYLFYLWWGIREGPTERCTCTALEWPYKQSLSSHAFIGSLEEIADSTFGIGWIHVISCCSYYINIYIYICPTLGQKTWFYCILIT